MCFLAQDFHAWWHRCTDSFTNFSSPFFIMVLMLDYLEMAGNHSYRPQSIVHIKQFVLQRHDFSVSWEHLQNHWWHFVWVLGVIQC